MIGRRGLAAGPLAVALVLAAAAAVALVVLRPLHAGSVGFDAAASVIHFDRLVAGRHLESFITATPKPLLTLVDGSLMATFHDWRTVAWAAIGAFAVCVAAAAWLASSVGGVVAGTGAALLLVSSPPLLGDVAIAYAMPWATALCLLAGIAMTRPRPRPALAGLLLGAAILARLEVVAIVGAGIIALVGREVVGRRDRSRVDRSAYWILLAVGAFPAMCIHDLLLTGDPLFWMKVSEEFSRQAPDAVRSAGEIVVLLVRTFAAERVIAVLAAVGVVWLARERRWSVLVGILGATLGVAAFLVVLALRGTYVSNRYLAAIDVGVRMSAAFGAGATVMAAATFVKERLGRVPLPAPWDRLLVPVALAVLVIGAAVWRPGFIDSSVRQSASTTQAEARHADMVLPVLRCAIGSLPGRVQWPPASTTLVPAVPAGQLVLGPILLRPRLAHDLDLPVFAVAGVVRDQLQPGAGFLPGGVVVFHDALSDRPPEAFSILAIDRPTTVGDIVLTPLLADARDRVWVDWIGRPDGPPAPTSCAAT